MKIYIPNEIHKYSEWKLNIHWPGSMQKSTLNETWSMLPHSVSGVQVVYAASGVYTKFSGRLSEEPFP